MTNQQDTEKLADAVHLSWSHWMQHLFAKSISNTDGSVTIPKPLVDRWSRQMKTDYSDLSEQEKESDRRQAKKLMAIKDKKEPGR